MILILIVDESSAVSRRETAESGDDMQQAPEITDVLEYMDSVVVYQHTVYQVSYQHTGYQWLALALHLNRLIGRLLTCQEMFSK